MQGLKQHIKERAKHFGGFPDSGGDLRRSTCGNWPRRTASGWPSIFQGRKWTLRAWPENLLRPVRRRTWRRAGLRLATLSEQRTLGGLRLDPSILKLGSVACLLQKGPAPKVVCAIALMAVISAAAGSVLLIRGPS